MTNLLAVLVGKTRSCIVEYRITGCTRSFELERGLWIFCFRRQDKSIELVSGGHRVGGLVVNNVTINLILFVLNIVLTNLINIGLRERQIVFGHSFPPGLGHGLEGGVPGDEGGEGVGLILC